MELASHRFPFGTRAFVVGLGSSGLDAERVRGGGDGLGQEDVDVDVLADPATADDHALEPRARVR